MSLYNSTLATFDIQAIGKQECIFSLRVIKTRGVMKWRSLLVVIYPNQSITF